MTQIQPNHRPPLRFHEFSGEWCQELLGDFFSFKNGVNADKSAYGKGYKFINVLDIIADRPINSENIIGSVSISDKEFEKNKVVYGDILFQRSSETREEVGQSNVYLDQDNAATFGGFVIRGHPKKEISPEYFHSLLKTTKVRKDLTSRSGGSTRYNVGQGSLSQVSIKVAPTLPEQQKIAAFLSSVDRKIALLGQKKALLQRYKKGMMQKLFSQELRFKDAQGHDFPDWDEKRLGEVADFTKGKGISKSDINDDGVTPCVRYGQLYTHYAENISHVVSKTNVPIKQLVLSKENDVIIPASGETALDIATASCVTLSGVALGGDLNIIRSSLNGVFLAYYLNSDMKYEIARLAQGISVVHLYAGQLKTLLLSIPSQKEQQKIADFLSSVDRKIDLVSSELDHAKAFKKGLLQQMFI